MAEGIAVFHVLLSLSFISTSTAMTPPTMPQLRREIYVPPDINQMTSDARMWYLAGVANANRNLESFGIISNGIEKKDNINEPLKQQLGPLLIQVSDANQNTKELVPKLRYLVDSLVSWTRNPGWLDKLKLKTTIAYINGKRDNKSYYLQNGAGLWFKLRLDEYLRKIPDGPIKNPEKDNLIRDFETLEDKILLARDTLDDAAQEYVKGITQLVNLVGDVGKNEGTIRNIVDKMKAEMDKGSQPILTTAEEAVVDVQTKIDSL